jgi:hypothetical protein
MSSANSFYSQSLVGWLESVMPIPAHVPDEMKQVYGENPLLHLCPLIAEYMGPNPFYFIPDNSNFQMKEKIKQATQEKDNVLEVYDAFFYEMTNSSLKLIPTQFPQFDEILAPSLMSTVSTLQSDHNMIDNPYQHYVKSLLTQHNKFFRKKLYNFRYLPPLSQNATPTYSITNTISLYDNSLVILNEQNIFIWPAKYLHPALPHQKLITNRSTTSAQSPSPKPPSVHDGASSINADNDTTILDILQNTSLASLSSTETFETCYEALNNENKLDKSRPFQPNQSQLKTNQAFGQFYLGQLQQNQSIYKRNRISKLLPHLQSHPYLYHSYDMSTNVYNVDILLYKLPHQLTKKKLRILAQQKRQFLASNPSQSLSPSELNDKFEQLCDISLMDDDYIYLDEYFDNQENENDFQQHSSSGDDNDDEDEDDSDDSDDYSSSGDNDSDGTTSDDDSDEDSYDDDDNNHQPKKRKKKGGFEFLKKHECPAGHAIYTAIHAIPPLFNIKPANDPLLRNYGISMHSPRLFLTGCQHGHVVLHDGLTGFSKVVGASKFPIVQIAHINTHQHYSQLNQNEIIQITKNAKCFEKLNHFYNGDRGEKIPLKNPQQQNNQTKINSIRSPEDHTIEQYDINSEILYHDDTRIFPLIVTLDQSGVVMYWDAISSTLISLYTQNRGFQDSLTQTQNPATIYNFTGMLKMSLCAVPLLPSVQRQTRFGNIQPRTPSQTPYATQTSSVLAMIFNKYQERGLDLKTGLPKKVNINEPNFDTFRQPWSPFIGFPFRYSTPKLNAGIIMEFQNVDRNCYIVPFEEENREAGGIDLLSPTRTTFASPTIVVTPYRSGQLTFCDLRNISAPTFYTFAHKQHVTNIAYIGGLLWTTSWDCSLKSWDLRYLSTPVHTIQCSNKHITALAGLDDQYIIIATAEKQMKIFDISKLAINRTYSVHVLNDCEEFINGVDFSQFHELIQINEGKIEKLRQAFSNFDQQNIPENQKIQKTDSITQICHKLSIPIEDHPLTTAQLLEHNPLRGISSRLLSIYPNLVHTQVFHQWLLTHNLSYVNDELVPLVTSYCPETNRVISNMLTAFANNGEYVPISRNQTQRIDYSLAACSFDWDVEELIQHIITIDGVIFTTSKECKCKVGLNKLMGSITPWATSIDVTSQSYDDIGM